MKIISLCSGSKGNCSILQHGKTTLMVDCGASQKYIRTRLSELKITLDQIDAVLITHDHSDHIRALKMCAGLPCFGCAPVDSLIPLVPLEKKQFGDFWVTPLPLSHDAPNTVGYLFEAGTEKLVYMTDTGYVPKRLLKIIQNAEIYFIESNHDIELLMKTNRPQYIKARIYSDRGHLCNEDCAKVLRQIVGPSTREIILAHLSEEANDPHLAYQVVYDALKNHPLCSQFHLQVAKQFEICTGGNQNEEAHDGNNRSTDCLECVFDV